MIEVRHLSKYFGAIKAVDDVSFEVEKGEILGFLGPNGAGKSTTMRMITGFIPPSGGTAVIGGADIIADSLAARKKIGYLPENAPVYPDMTVKEYLDFCARIRGFSGAKGQRVVSRTIERCVLTEAAYQTVSTLSKGFKQRVCFAQSILHDPEYLIFDEPTDGLDPNQKHEVRRMIRRMSADKAIILSTHILDEVDAVCTRAIIIAEGRLVVDETPDELRARSAIHGSLALTLAPTAPEGVLACINSIQGVSKAEVLEIDPELKLRVYPREAGVGITDRVISSMKENGFAVTSVFVEKGRLDDVFRAVTGGDSTLPAAQASAAR
jgi:ABC-2 type transport system ATP-binding protein